MSRSRDCRGWRSGAGGRRFPALGLVLVVFGGCSPGENSVLNPGSNRDGLTSLPETLRVGTSAADRSYRPQVSTGALATLRIARSDSVEAIAFLRFTSIPDTATLSSARVGLRWAGGSGADLRLAAYRVGAGDLWTETGLTAADTSRLPPPEETLDVYPGTLTPLSDTTIVRRAVEIPGSVLREWKRDPSANVGIALRLTASSPAGELRFLAREATLDTLVANPQIEYLSGDSVLSTGSPAADAYIYLDRRGPPAGDGATFALADWLPARALLHFPVLDSLAARVGPGAKRLTINRAVLRLHLVDSPGTGDTLRLAMHRVLTEWSEASEPDSVALATTDAVADLPGAIETPGLLRLEIGGLVRGWVEGLENHGLAVRSVTEASGSHRLLFHTREAPDSVRPELEVVFTRPPDPRWGTLSRGGAR